MRRSSTSVLLSSVGMRRNSSTGVSSPPPPSSVLAVSGSLGDASQSSLPSLPQTPLLTPSASLSAHRLPRLRSTTPLPPPPADGSSPPSLFASASGAGQRSRANTTDAPSTLRAPQAVPISPSPFPSTGAPAAAVADPLHHRSSSSGGEERNPPDPTAAAAAEIFFTLGTVGLGRRLTAECLRRVLDYSPELRILRLTDSLRRNLDDETLSWVGEQCGRRLVSLTLQGCVGLLPLDAYIPSSSRPLHKTLPTEDPSTSSSSSLGDSSHPNSNRTPSNGRRRRKRRWSLFTSVSLTPVPAAEKTTPGKVPQAIQPPQPPSVSPFLFPQLSLPPNPSPPPMTINSFLATPLHRDVSGSSNTGMARHLLPRGEQSHSRSRTSTSLSGVGEEGLPANRRRSRSTMYSLGGGGGQDITARLEETSGLILPSPGVGASPLSQTGLHALLRSCGPSLLHLDLSFSHGAHRPQADRVESISCPREERIVVPSSDRVHPQGHPSGAEAKAEDEEQKDTFPASPEEVRKTLFPSSAPMQLRSTVSLADDSTLEVIAGSCQNIRHLSLAEAAQNFTDSGLEILLASTGASLESLDLSGCEGLTDRTLAAIGIHCGRLEHLSLAGSSPAHPTLFTDRGLGFLCRIGRNLLSLNLAHSVHITERGLRPLMETLRDNCLRLDLTGWVHASVRASVHPSGAVILFIYSFILPVVRRFLLSAAAVVKPSQILSWKP